MKALWRSVVTITAVTLLGAAAAALPAQGTARRAMRGPDAARGPHERGGDRMAGFLGLTEEQKAAWAQLHEEFRESMRATHEEQRPNMDKLRQALDAAQPDPATVGRLVIAMHQHRRQMEQRHEAFQQRLRALLTPEQQLKFDAAQALRPRSHGPGHGPFGPGMFGPPEDGGDGEAPPPPPDRRPERF